MDNLQQSIIFAMGTTGTKNVEKDFKKVTSVLVASGKKIEALRAQLDIKGVKSGAIAGMDLKTLKEFDHTFKKVSREARQFKMHWLGIMFAGMAVDRVMTGLFKGMLKDYKEFTKAGATPLSNSLVKLEANWKFLKFSMMEAMSGILTGGLDWISNFVRWLSGVNPNWLIGIGSALLFIAGAAKLFMVGGQIALGLNSFKLWMADLKVSKLKEAQTGLDNLAKTGSKISAGQWVLGGAIALALGISTWKMFTDEKTSPIARGFNIASGAAMGAWLGTNVFPGLGTLWGGVIGASAMIALNIVDIVNEKGNREAYLKFADTVYAQVNEATKDPSKVDAAGKLLGDQFAIITANAISGIDDQSTKQKLGEAFDSLFTSYSRNAISEEQFRDQLAAMVNMGLPTNEEAIQKGSEIGTDFSSGLTASAGIGTDAMFEQMATKGNEFLTVDMKESVNDFLTDEVSGMAAMQKAAEKYNETLAKPVSKTVTVTTISSGGSSSVNTWTHA